MIDSTTSGPDPSHNGHPHSSGTPGGGATGCGAFPHQKMIIHKWGSVTYSSLKSASPTSSPPLVALPSAPLKRSASPLTIAPGPALNRHAFVTTSRFDPFSFDEEVTTTPPSTISPPLKGKRENAVNGHKVKVSKAPKFKISSSRPSVKAAEPGSDSDTPLLNLCKRGNNTTKTGSKRGKAPRVSILPDPYPYPSSDEAEVVCPKEPLTTKRGRISKPVKMFKPTTPAPLAAASASPSTFRKRGKPIRKFRAGVALQRRRAPTKPPLPSPSVKGGRHGVDMNYALARMRSSLPLLIPLPQPPSPTRFPDPHDDEGEDDALLATPSPRCSIVLPRIDHVLTTPLNTSSCPSDSPAPVELERDRIAEDVTDLRGIFFGNTYIDLAAAPHRPASPCLDPPASPPLPLTPTLVTQPPFTVRKLTGDRVLNSTAALAPTPHPPVDFERGAEAQMAILNNLTSTAFVKAHPLRGTKSPKASPGKKGRTAPVLTRRSTRYSLRSSSSSSVNGVGGDAGNTDPSTDGAFGLIDISSPKLPQSSPPPAANDAPPSPPPPLLDPPVSDLMASPSAPEVRPPVVKERKYFISKGQAKTKPNYTKNIFDWTPNLLDKEEDSMQWSFEVASPPRPECPKSGSDPDNAHTHKDSSDGPVRVRGVRQAYQCHEYGEVQDINDDVEYLLAGLKVNTSIATKCLSILGMANKCMSAPFLTYVRSRGLVNMIYQALWKTALDPDTTLCAATFFYVLTFDKRMLADADLHTIDSLLRLYEKFNKMAPDSSIGSNFLSKNCSKIRSLFASLLRENPSEPNNQLAYLKDTLDAEDPTSVASIALWGKRVVVETLNKFCLAKDPQVEPAFTNHMRESGAQDILIDIIIDLQQRVKDNFELVESNMSPANLKECYQRLIPLLNVVGICTSLNAKNQLHLDTYEDGEVLDATIWLLSHSIKKYLSVREMGPNTESPELTLPITDKGVYVDLITSCLKVIIDMTYQNESGCLSFGNRARHYSLFTDLVNLASCLKVKETTKEMYDLMVLTMGCLINLTEKCESNCHIYMKQWYAESLANEGDHSAKRLIKTLFLYMEAAAIEYESEGASDSLPLDQDGEVKTVTIDEMSYPDTGMELSADHEGVEKSVTKVLASNKNARDTLEEQKNKVFGKPNSDANSLSMYLQKAGRHMEYSTIASYISLFLGCLIYKNKEYTLRLRNLLPPDDQPFQPLIAILEKYLKFIKYTSIIGMVSTNYLSIKRILDAYQDQQHWQ